MQMAVGGFMLLVHAGRQWLTTHHLLHTVPVDQSVWVREVGLVVLLISHHKLAAVTKTERQRDDTAELVLGSGSSLGRTGLGVVVLRTWPAGTAPC